MSPATRRIVLPAIGIALGLALLLAGVLLRQTPSLSSSGICGPFRLVDKTGKSVTDADFRGKPTLVFFGYTHCPDVCPTTLASLSQVLGDLGPDAPVAVLFITVDPERDTPAVLKDYLSSFDPRIVGLTGDPESVAAALRLYRVYAKKVPTQGSDYTMDHTGVVYLMNRDGAFVQSFNAELDNPKDAAAALSRLF